VFPGCVRPSGVESVDVAAGSSSTERSLEYVTYDGPPAVAFPVALLPGDATYDVFSDHPCT
jgi:hypothetical protein